MANEYCDVKAPEYALEQGRLIDTIPRVLAEGRFPIWAARFHQERARLAGQKPEWNSWSYTPGELVACPVKSGDVLHIIGCFKGGLTEAGKLVYPKFQPNATIVDFGINISDIYEQLHSMTPEQGVIKVSQSDIQKYAGRDMPQKEVPDNKLVRLLFRDSKEVPRAFAERKDILKTAINTSFVPFPNGTAMGVYFAKPNDRFPKLMAWGVFRLDYRSQAVAYYGVDGGYGRLASVAPEALGAKNFKAVDVRRYTKQEAEAYLKGLETLRNTFGADSQVVRQLGSLEGKL